jgi:hypothetical protein
MSRPFKFQNIFKLLIAILFLYSCNKDGSPAPTPVHPKVVISFVDSVTETSVVIGGYISDTGYAPILDAGFYYATDTTRLITTINTTSQISIGPLRGGGGFRAKITGLTAGTWYSIASYAKNSSGFGLSSDSLRWDYKFTTKKLLAIGDTYGGGKVAYLMQPGDTTYNANVQHGLIASISDIGQGSPWSNASTSTTVVCNALGVNLLQGISNTDSIIKYNPSPTITAAAIAKAHRGGNYSDWYLPNKNELNKLYIGRIAIGTTVNGGYWSSSEFDATNSYKFHAWYQNFNSGSPDVSLKNAVGYVRAIRAF